MLRVLPCQQQKMDIIAQHYVLRFIKIGVTWTMMSSLHLQQLDNFDFLFLALS